MADTVVKSKGDEREVKTVADSRAVLERLQGWLQERDRCVAGCERFKTGNGAVYADYLIHLNHADVEIQKLIPEAFKFLVELKAEVTK